MMTSRERINRILDFKIPDRIGVKDLFWEETRRSWQSGLKDDLEEHFNFDIRVFDMEKRLGEEELKKFFSEENNKDRFLAVSFREPFQRYADEVGLETALENIGRNPKEAAMEFKRGLDERLSAAMEMLDKGYRFDGLWLFGDLAHEQGTFFSPEFYAKHLFGFHKAICYFFASYGIPTILHSDGNISSIIPQLIKAGFRALHPVQYSAGLNIIDLKRRYKNDIAFFGNFDIDTLRFPRAALKDIMLERLDICKEGGGYIFGLDGPIGPKTPLKDYEFILGLVKEYGGY